MTVVISKSRFLAGLNCPKLLWCMFNAPEKIPPPDAATQSRFDQGHEIGALAKKRYPGGIEVTEKGYAPTVLQTREFLKKNKPVFEASFCHKTAYCRIDVLAPTNEGWDIIEVKSTSSVKEEHIPDVAFQRYCAENSGLHVHRCYLLHVNSAYVRKGGIDPQQFFTIEDVTEQVSEFLPSVPDLLLTQLKIIKGRMPKPELGTECVDPSECPVCATDLPENNVTELYRLGKKAYQLINKGIVRIADLPKGFEFSDKQEIQRECIRTGKPHVDKKALGKFLAALKYPLHFLDFEAVNPAIPLFDGTRPFQQIPFQFSLHIIEKPGAKPEHTTYLAPDANDPRPGVIDTLKVIRPAGTILAYNLSFEKGILAGLAEARPKERWLRAAADRLTDLMVPFRNFWYYDARQHGSCSIKQVLPALTGKSYKHLEISQGDSAAQQFLDAMYKKEGKITEKFRSALLAYCSQDTEGMIEIMRVLDKAAG
jgi:hypothetical protein